MLALRITLAGLIAAAGFIAWWSAAWALAGEPVQLEGWRDTFDTLIGAPFVAAGLVLFIGGGLAAVLALFLRPVPGGDWWDDPDQWGRDR